MATNRAFACPLNQYVLADALELRAIRVNRILRQLHERKLMTLRDRKVTVQDMRKLKKPAGFQEQQVAQMEREKN